LHEKSSTTGEDVKAAELAKAADSELLVTLLVESNREAPGLVRATVERATELLHFQDNDSRAIVRSVDEALTNVMRHAYEGKPGLPIEITCRKLLVESNGSKKAGIEIILEDAGNSPDLSEVKGRCLDEVRPGGLGLHFIRESMDQVEFSRKNGKNQLRLVKYLVPATAVARPAGE
jgi:anti-sigma regulatory factor (Ser/Thr protein kinase)